MPTQNLDVGAPAYCKDGLCGSLRMVVMNTEKHRITDLVIDLAPSAGLSVIVPVALAEITDDRGVHLSIGRAELETYPEYHRDNRKRSMSQTDFSFEFLSEIEQPAEPLRVEAEQRLRALTGDHSDIIGASVAIEELTAAETPHAFQTRIVVYMRPSNVVAVEKAPDAITSLQQTLNIVERQVREKRRRLRERWKQP
ncbi:MAG: hypothetical protein JXC32_16390 [Anaerolineae bacterium]|nr:hypothetical protein [Anaerolineae bacterium]